MSSNKAFNPIETSKRIEKSYREYIATTIHFDDPELQSQLEAILKKPRYLAKGPYLEAAPPYHKAENVNELIAEGVLCESMLKLGNGDSQKFDPNRPLYTHQVKAIRKAVAGRNYAVVTGTGSGKTECFLLPIINDILKEFESNGPSSGVRAMILYPMNALANDQLKRLRELLEGTDITFGRYTGDTMRTEDEAKKVWREENPDQKKLPNEIISREEIHKNPPNILLTNYSMLEYLLLRPSDASLFKGEFGRHWRHIAIDEAHIYSGALGTEIAFLIRRLKARISSETGVKPKLQCYATSATIGSEEDMPKVAVFAQDLFGEPFESDKENIDVITSSKDKPQEALDKNAWGTLPIAAWNKLRRYLLDNDEATTEAIKEILTKYNLPDSVLARMDTDSPYLNLGKILLGEASTINIVNKCESLFDLTDPTNIEQLNIEGLQGDARGIEALTSMVEILSIAQRSSGVPILSSRYHSFLRAPEGLYIDLWHKSLTPNKTTSIPYEEDPARLSPVYEVSVCRHCGQAYILGEYASDAKSNVAWLNPQHEGTNADDEFIPREYFRLIESLDDVDENESVQWLCPICGSLHAEEIGGPHRFQHEEVKRCAITKNASVTSDQNEYISRCKHCGYSSNNAIQGMRVSPEAAGSVVCYDLVRDIPSFKRNIGEDDINAGSVICFSDKRQDAAFFAPAMDRTYGNITKRQFIYEAINYLCEDEDDTCSFSSIVSYLEEAFETDPRLEGCDDDAKLAATAWMLDEITSPDSRNSLEGLGIIKLKSKLTREIKKLYSDTIEDDIEDLKEDCEGFAWLDMDTYLLFLEICVETLKEGNGVYTKRGVSAYRTNLKKYPCLITKNDVERKASVTIRFVGNTTGPENKRSRLIRKYVKHNYSEEISREDVAELLERIYDRLFAYVKKKDNKKNLFVDGNGFYLPPSSWEFAPYSDEDVIYRCDKCGCESHLNTHGICLTTKCDGHPKPLTFEEAFSKDSYYKETYQDTALPLRIEEHTAQLSVNKARTIQQLFIDGEVNVLSCTTTFELGVDVGELRAIFMRNVPPKTANYAQRAGRVGRRAGMPGYAITFARLRPHDIAFFKNPESMIAGKTTVPMCYLNNTAIAIRHVFAVAMSEFFRSAPEPIGSDYIDSYHSFMNLDEAEPNGIKELRAYLEKHPKKIEKQLNEIFGNINSLYEEIGINTWEWINELTDNVDETGLNGGRLMKAHALIHADYQRIQDRFKVSDDHGERAKFENILGVLEKTKTISLLAENGVLPKYGFPTDVVSLNVPAENVDNKRDLLRLQRGLRQAIREYAPGSEIVADKLLWKSVGIKKPKGYDLIVRNFGKCPECNTFIWPIDNRTNEAECPVCKAKVTLSKKMLVPSFGFEAKESDKQIGIQRPRSKGYAKIYFSQHWPDQTVKKTINFDGGNIYSEYASNGQLCVLNQSHICFCRNCHAAANTVDKIEHWRWCPEPSIAHYDALGSDFVSDVLGLTFVPSRKLPTSEEEWESALWAIFAAASKILEIPETEIGGTLYSDEAENYTLMLYDDVPGGAGHVLSLKDKIPELIREAYKIVSECDCGIDTCCYGCIANYYNQNRQHLLSRRGAINILGNILNL